MVFEPLRYNSALETHVGFHKGDAKLPVYARMLLKASGISYPTFHVHKSDADKSIVEAGNRLISWKDINYIEKYARTSLEESRKAVQEDLAKPSASNGRC
jgi:hypothetical protein